MFQTPEQVAATKARIAALAEQHGLKSDGYHVLIPDPSGGVMARIDMSAMDLDRFLMALFYNFKKHCLAENATPVATE